MLYTSYQEYLENLQGTTSRSTNTNNVFIGESILAQEFDCLSDCASNYVMATDRERSCLVVCRVERLGNQAHITDITELSHPFTIYNLFNDAFVGETEAWHALVYTQREGGVNYDIYYNQLPLSNSSAKTLADMNSDILNVVKLLDIETGARIIVQDNLSKLLPLAYALQIAFRANIVFAGNMRNQRLSQSQILQDTKPQIYYYVAGGMKFVEMELGKRYGVTITPEDLNLPCKMFDNQLFSSIIGDASFDFDYMLGTVPMKRIEVMVTLDACNNRTVSLFYDHTTVDRTMLSGVDVKKTAVAISNEFTKIQSRVSIQE